MIAAWLLVAAGVAAVGVAALRRGAWRPTQYVLFAVTTVLCLSVLTFLVTGLMEGILDMTGPVPVEDIGWTLLGWGLALALLVAAASVPARDQGGRWGLLGALGIMAWFGGGFLFPGEQSWAHVLFILALTALVTALGIVATEASWDWSLKGNRAQVGLIVALLMLPNVFLIGLGGVGMLGAIMAYGPQPSLHAWTVDVAGDGPFAFDIAVPAGPDQVWWQLRPTNVADLFTVAGEGSVEDLGDHVLRFTGHGTASFAVATRFYAGLPMQENRLGDRYVLTNGQGDAMVSLHYRVDGPWCFVDERAEGAVNGTATFTMNGNRGCV